MNKFVSITVAAVVGVFALIGVANATGIVGSDDQAKFNKEEALLERFEARRSVEKEASISYVRRGPRGPRGFRGPKGAAGAAGPQGTIAGSTAVKSATAFLCGWESGPCSIGSVVATCPPGTVVLGGGYSGAGIRAFISAPVSGGWYVGAANEFNLSTTFNAFVQCGS